MFSVSSQGHLIYAFARFFSVRKKQFDTGNFYIGFAFSAFVHHRDDHMNVVCPFRINSFV